MTEIQCNKNERYLTIKMNNEALPNVNAIRVLVGMQTMLTAQTSVLVDRFVASKIVKSLHSTISNN